MYVCMFIYYIRTSFFQAVFFGVFGKDRSAGLVLQNVFLCMHFNLSYMLKPFNAHNGIQLRFKAPLAI